MSIRAEKNGSGRRTILRARAMVAFVINQKAQAVGAHRKKSQPLAATALAERLMVRTRTCYCRFYLVRIS